MREQFSAGTLLRVLGAGALSVGASLPWFWVDPLYDPISVKYPLVYESLAEPGLHGVDLVMFGIVATVLGLLFFDVNGRILSLVTTAAGIGIVIYCFQYLLFSAPIGFHGRVVPVVGWYLTLLGGLLFAGTWFLKPADLQTREAESPR